MRFSEVGHVLSCQPTPKLKRLLADPPAPREVGELAQVAVMVRERQGMFVVIQVQLADLFHACAFQSERARA